MILPLHADDRGQLTVAENSSLPFEARRVFWLTGVPEAAERGGHAHSTCAEVLYAVSGAVKIDLSDGTRDLTVELRCLIEVLSFPQWYGAGCRFFP